MKVSAAWRARHASMIPLFAETQGNTDSSLNSLLSLTQGSDTTDSSSGLGRVQATQANIFSATQQPGRRMYNRCHHICTCKYLVIVVMADLIL